MTSALVLSSLVGLVFFVAKLVSDPGGWGNYALGVAACLVVLVRNLKVLQTSRKMASEPSVCAIADPAGLDEALESERAILFKHSTRCPVSAVVTDEVLRFAGTHPDWTIYVLKVIERRDLSDLVAERLGVPHASPQAFVIRHGRCVWHASHYEVTAQSLSRHLT